MFVIGLGTATPPTSFRQQDGWDIAQSAPEFQRLSPRARAIVRKVLLGDNGIETRRLALDSLSQAFDLNPDALHARFRQHAPPLATQAVERALAMADLQPAEVDGLIISTCTGYLCPGLTSYVAEQLRLRPNVAALDLVGQGCGAALPNFRSAAALIHSGQCDRVLSVCVEICSAAFYLDDDPGVLISACLFGDGAGAVLFSRSPSSLKLPRIEWKTALSHLDPSQRDALRFEQKNGMLRNILTRQVPSLAGERVRELLAALLHEASLEKRNISAWILHAGGRDVLTALHRELELSETDLRWSASVLRQFGNVSSPSVIFVLEQALKHQAEPGHWCVMSFGAGFSCHGAILEVA